MRLRILFTLVILVVYNIVYAQVNKITWQNTIGGSGWDALESVSQTNDGGYIIGGTTYSGISGDKTEACFDSPDYWVLKLNNMGAIEWQNNIGGTNDDILMSVLQTADGGYILGGYSYSGISGDKTEASLGLSDYWVVKLNSLGSIEWQNTIGGNKHDELQSIRQTSDGGYILAGTSYSMMTGDKTEPNLGSGDYWVVKLNSVGVIEWQNTIGGDDTDHLYSIQQTDDGGYILGGDSRSDISGDKTEYSVYIEDYWVLKLNAAGDIEWQNTIGGDYYDVLNSIQQTTDGGYILGGWSDSGISGDKTEEAGGKDYWVVKLYETGDIEWQNTIGGSGDDQLNAIQQTIDGGYILAGFSSSGLSGDKKEISRGGDDYWVVKINAIGDIEWQNVIGGTGRDLAKSIRQTADSGYIVGGYSTSGISNDKTEASLGQDDYWVIAMNDTGGSWIKDSEHMFAIYPNPASVYVTIEYADFRHQLTTATIYNILGEAVSLFELDGDDKTSTFALNLPPGMYTVLLQDALHSNAVQLIIQ